MNTVIASKSQTTTQFVFALTDYGSSQSPFTDLLASLKAGEIKAEDLLSFSDDVYVPICLLELPPPEPEHIAKSVAEFVHFLLKIEFLAPPTLEDTISAIRSFGLDDTSRRVRRTYDLVVKEYSTDSSFVSKAIDVPKLLQLHQSIVDVSDDPTPGKMRCRGVGRMVNDVSVPYPHHSILPAALANLSQTVYFLLKLLDARTDRLERVRGAFALSAFLQFHFLALHPFGDGNGRIARLLSKRVLEPILSIPFPQYTDRDGYILALTAGDDECARGMAYVAPRHLFIFMLTAASEYYLSTFPHMPHLVALWDDDDESKAVTLFKAYAKSRGVAIAIDEAITITPGSPSNGTTQSEGNFNALKLTYSDLGTVTGAQINNLKLNFTIQCTRTPRVRSVPLGTTVSVPRILLPEEVVEMTGERTAIDEFIDSI